jgi:hypothetical protein
MRRWVFGVLVLVAATALLAGTGGYTTMAADRGLNVQVSDDAGALVGVEDQSPVKGVVGGDPVEALALTNNLDQSLSVNASVPDDAPVTVADSNFGDGVTLQCTAESDEQSVPVTITASGDGVNVELTRSVDVTCTAPTTTTTTTTTTTVS